MDEDSEMITLIDRADGTAFAQLSPEEFRVLQQHLVRESEEDFDYYLNDATLDLLAEAGLSSSAVELLSARMKHRGLDVGWVLGPAEGESYSGSLVDAEVVGLGGIRIDLMGPQGLISWTYSGVDGHFEVFAKEGATPTFLRLSGRGDLILRQLPVSGSGEQGQFEVQTLRGSVQTEDGEALPGVTVQLQSWNAKEKVESASWTHLGGDGSWGDTDAQGRFSIPVSLPEDVGPLQIELELTAVTGQTLESVTLTLNSEAGFELGVLRAPKPLACEVEASVELVVE